MFLILPVVRPTWASTKALLVFWSPLLVQTVFGYLSTNYVDAFVILCLMSTSELGVYTLVYQLMGSFLQLATLGGSLVLPYLISVESSGDRALQHRVRVIQTASQCMNDAGDHRAAGNADDLSMRAADVRRLVRERE